MKGKGMNKEEEEKIIGILISGKGSNAKAIENAISTGKLDAKLAFVGSDNPDAEGLVWAKGKGIPTFVVDFKEIRKEVAENPFGMYPAGMISKMEGDSIEVEVKDRDKKHRHRTRMGYCHNKLDNFG